MYGEYGHQLSGDLSSGPGSPLIQCKILDLSYYLCAFPPPSLFTHKMKQLNQINSETPTNLQHPMKPSSIAWVTHLPSPSHQMVAHHQLPQAPEGQVLTKMSFWKSGGNLVVFPPLLNVFTVALRAIQRYLQMYIVQKDSKRKTTLDIKGSKWSLVSDLQVSVYLFLNQEQLITTFSQL